MESPNVCKKPHAFGRIHNRMTIKETYMYIAIMLHNYVEYYSLLLNANFAKKYSSICSISTFKIEIIKVSNCNYLVMEEFGESFHI